MPTVASARRRAWAEAVPRCRVDTRWPAAALVVLLAAGCARGALSGVDSWAVRRNLDGKAGVTSISEINLARPPATRTLQPVVLRRATRGRLQVIVQVDAPLADSWTPSAALLDRELEAGLDWLSRLAATEARGVRLQVTLVDRDGRRQERRLHDARSTIVVDLLVPVDAAPSSRSAAMAQALAVALHEAVHALRGRGDSDRDADEYRASLVNACYLLDVVRGGDTIAFTVAPAQAGGDLAGRHSHGAAVRVMRDLRRVAGSERLPASDADALRKARNHCVQRLQPEA